MLNRRIIFNSFGGMPMAAALDRTGESSVQRAWPPVKGDFPSQAEFWFNVTTP